MSVSQDGSPAGISALAFLSMNLSIDVEILKLALEGAFNSTDQINNPGDQLYLTLAKIGCILNSRTFYSTLDRFRQQFSTVSSGEPNLLFKHPIKNSTDLLKAHGTDLPGIEGSTMLHQKCADKGSSSDHLGSGQDALSSWQVFQAVTYTPVAMAWRWNLWYAVSSRAVQCSWVCRF